MTNISTIDRFDYPYHATAAAKMLGASIDAYQRRGVSLRTLAHKLGYRSPTSLSHMHLGRLPIPIAGCVEMADLLGIDRRAFLLAVMNQRYPNIEFVSILGIDFDTLPAEPSSLNEEIDFTTLPSRAVNLRGEWGITTWRGLVDWCRHADLKRRVSQMQNYGRTTQSDIEAVLRERGMLN